MRLILAGIAGGTSLSVLLLLTFRAIGFGWTGGGVLLDPAVQSAKLIAVWTELEPLPLVVTRPSIVAMGFVGLGVLHAAVYGMVAGAWPRGVWARAVRMAALLFSLAFVFWEFFTPFNQFGEPLPLIGLELRFWAIIALGEGSAIAFVMEWPMADQHVAARGEPPSIMNLRLANPYASRVTSSHAKPRK